MARFAVLEICGRELLEVAPPLLFAVMVSKVPLEFPVLFGGLEVPAWLAGVAAAM